MNNLAMYTVSNFGIGLDLEPMKKKMKLSPVSLTVDNRNSTTNFSSRKVIRHLAVVCLFLLVLPFLWGEGAAREENQFNPYWITPLGHESHVKDTTLYVSADTDPAEYPYAKGLLYEVGSFRTDRYYEFHLSERHHTNGTWAYHNQRMDSNTIEHRANEGEQRRLCNGELAFVNRIERDYGTWNVQTRKISQTRSLNVGEPLHYWFCPNKSFFDNLHVSKRVRVYLEIRLRTNLNSRWLTVRTHNVALTVVHNHPQEANIDMQWPDTQNEPTQIVAHGGDSYEDKFGTTETAGEPANNLHVRIATAVEEKFDTNDMSVHTKSVAAEDAPRDIFIPSEQHANWPGDDNPLHSQDYGAWSFNHDYSRFYFAPNADAINSLLPGERVTSALTYAWRDEKRDEECHSCPTLHNWAEDTARVEITAPRPALSLTTPDSPVTEGQDALFTITTETNWFADRSLDISYSTSNNTGQFLEPQDLAETKLKFTQTDSGGQTATLAIPTKEANGGDETHGEIAVTLHETDFYTVVEDASSSSVAIHREDNEFKPYWKTPLRQEFHVKDTTLYVSADTDSAEYPYAKGLLYEVGSVWAYRYYEFHLSERHHTSGKWAYHSQRMDSNAIQHTANEGEQRRLCNGDLAFVNRIERDYGTWYVQTRKVSHTSSLHVGDPLHYWFCPNKSFFDNMHVSKRVRVYLEIQLRTYVNSRWWTVRTHNVSLTVHNGPQGANIDMQWPDTQNDPTQIVAHGGDSYEGKFGTTAIAGEPTDNLHIRTATAVEEKFDTKGESVHTKSVAAENAPRDIFIPQDQHANWPGDDNPLHSQDYGTWSFNHDYRRFYFAPNTDAINSLLPGERVTSALTFAWRDEECHSCPTLQNWAEDTARVEITAPRPALSLAAPASPVTEGQVALYTVTTDTNWFVDRSLDISYSVENNTGEFLEVPDEPVMTKLVFTPTDSGGLTATLAVPTKEANGRDEAHGEIAVTLLGTDFYTAVEDANSSSIAVHDAEIPQLSLSATDEVDNGDIATISVQTDVMPVETLTATFRLTSYFGDFIATSVGLDQNNEITRELNFVADTDGNLVAEVPIQTAVDPTSRGGSIRIWMDDDDTPLRLFEAINLSASVVVNGDITTPLSTVTITTANDRVEEGQDIQFRISIDTVPASGLYVGLGFVQTNFLVDFAPPRFVAVEPPEQGVAISLSTRRLLGVNNTGTVTVSIKTSTTYTAGLKTPGSEELTNNSVTFTILDDDTPPESVSSEEAYSVAGVFIEKIIDDNFGSFSSPDQEEAEKATLSIASVSSSVDEGEKLKFRITADKAVESDLTVNLAVSDPGGKIVEEPMESVVLVKDQSSAIFTIDSIDDDIAANEDAVVTVSLKNSQSYRVSRQSSSAISISDAKDRAARQRQVATGLNALIPELSTHMAANTRSTISDRVTTAFAGADESVFAYSGNSSVKGMLTSFGESVNGDAADWRSLLGNSSFAVNVAPDSDAHTDVMFWGKGYQKSMDFAPSGSLPMEGDIFTGHLGLEAKVGTGILAGVSLVGTDTEMEFSSQNYDDIKYNVRTSGLHPYFGISIPERDLHLHTTLGYGFGTVQIGQQEYKAESLDSNYYSLSVDGRQRIHTTDLLFDRGTELSLVGAAWNAAQVVDSGVGLTEGMRTSAHQYNLAVEAKNSFGLFGQGNLQQTVSLGMREDAQDTRSELGVELETASSFSYLSDYRISGIGQLLIATSDSDKHVNAEGSFNFDSHMDQLGFVMELSTAFGNGLDRYLSDSKFLFDREGTGIASDDARLSTEIGYGLNVCDENCVMTPYGGVSTDFNGVSVYEVGNRIASGRIFTLDLAGQNKVATGEKNEYQLDLSGSINW